MQFVAFTWPNLCLWVVILSGICKLNLKSLKTFKTPKNLKLFGKKLGFYQPWCSHNNEELRCSMDVDPGAGGQYAPLQKND